MLRAVPCVTTPAGRIVGDRVSGGPLPVPRTVRGVVTLVGLGFGAIIRHTAGAIAAVGLIFIQALLVNLVFPDPDSAAGHYVLLWAGQAISLQPRANIRAQRRPAGIGRAGGERGRRHRSASPSSCVRRDRW